MSRSRPVAAKIMPTDIRYREAPPDLPFHVAASNSVPFAQGFKPQMKLLSRKPMIRTRDPVTGLEKLTLQDDEDDDDANKKPQPTAEEIRERQQREREEKERSYDEARARIFGDSPSGTPSGASTPGTTTPPLTGEGAARGNYRGRGRGRGGRGGRGGQRNDSYRNDSKADIPERRQVNNNGSPYRELFDPDAGSRPASRQQRGGITASPTRGPEAAIRNPRGPDNSGRGGFGFAKRGAKEG